MKIKNHDLASHPGRPRVCPHSSGSVLLACDPDFYVTSLHFFTVLLVKWTSLDIMLLPILKAFSVSSISLHRFSFHPFLFLLKNSGHSTLAFPIVWVLPISNSGFCPARPLPAIFPCIETGRLDWTRVWSVWEECSWWCVLSLGSAGVCVCFVILAAIDIQCSHPFIHLSW